MNNTTTDQTNVPSRIADRLTVILGVLGLLKEGAFGSLNSRQKSALVEVLATSEELRVLLKDLIDP